MTIIIKKAYVGLVEFLEANENKKVKTILEEIREMTKQKANLKTFKVNAEGEVYAIYCYYHKQWEIISDVPFGKKASSSTGYNTMCKVGTSEWTKMNKRVKSVGSVVLQQLEDGLIEASDISSVKEQLLVEAREIVTENMPDGFATLEDLPS